MNECVEFPKMNGVRSLILGGPFGVAAKGKSKAGVAWKGRHPHGPGRSDFHPEELTRGPVWLCVLSGRAHLFVGVG